MGKSSRTIYLLKIEIGLLKGKVEALEAEGRVIKEALERHGLLQTASVEPAAQSTDTPEELTFPDLEPEPEPAAPAAAAPQVDDSREFEPKTEPEPAPRRRPRPFVLKIRPIPKKNKGSVRAKRVTPAKARLLELCQEARERRLEVNLIRIVGPESPVPKQPPEGKECPICHKTFFSYYNVRRHMGSIHG